MPARIHALSREPAAQIVEQRQGARARHAIEPDIVFQHPLVMAEGGDGAVAREFQEARIGDREILALPGELSRW